MTALDGLVIGLLDRRHRDPTGSLILDLVPALRRRGAHVRLVDADDGAHRLDRPPVWDVTLLKSGSPGALHLAAAAEGHGVPSLNGAEPTRVAQDRLASATILSLAGLPLPRFQLAWLGPDAPTAAPRNPGPVIVKAARGSRGSGLWWAGPGELPRLARSLDAGPYLCMERVDRIGDDLKVFVAGRWMRGIERPFPAETLEQKRGRPAAVPAEIAEAARRAGDALGLRCYGCDFVRTADGWWLVDVNAFPGYKGAQGAAEAIAEALESDLTEASA